MEQLLEVKINPIEMNTSFQRAKLEVMSQVTPSYIMTRQVGGLDVSYKPGRLMMDSYEMRSSMGLLNVSDLARTVVNKSVQHLYEYMQSNASEGKQLLESGTTSAPSNLMAKIAASRMSQQDKQFGIGFIPNKPVDMEWQPENLSINYTPDDLNFNWQVSRTVNFKYTPASLEFNVEQYPSVEFNYVGSPIYAPPSSAPDYVS